MSETKDQCKIATLTWFVFLPRKGPFIQKSYNDILHCLYMPGTFVHFLLGISLLIVKGNAIVKKERKF